MEHGVQLGARDWDYWLPGIWSRLVLRQSGWVADRLDREFFPARASARQSKAGETPKPTSSRPKVKGSSAFRRYLACASRIDFSRYEAEDHPFLQIDSCWPGTFRYLAAPFVSLLTCPEVLGQVHQAMLLTHIRFRACCFAGKADAMRRTYGDPNKEVAAIARVWAAMDTPDLRIRYFPDILGLALGWVHEAILLGDRERLKLLRTPEVLPTVFNVSFSQLDFLEPELARFLDVWLELSVIENRDTEPYALSVDAQARAWLADSKRCPTPRSFLDQEALVASVVSAQLMTPRLWAEDMQGRAIPAALLQGPTWDERVSWDRSALAQTDRSKPRRVRQR